MSCIYWHVPVIPSPSETEGAHEKRLVWVTQQELVSQRRKGEGERGQGWRDVMESYLKDLNWDGEMPQQLEEHALLL